MAFRNIQIDIDDAVFQAALNRATTEGKAIGEIVVRCLTQYGASAAAVQPTVRAPAPVTTYTVQRGDTLGRIAQKFYGDPHKYPLIQEANNIVDAGRIWVGQPLTIPPLPGTATPATAPEPAPRPTSALDPEPAEPEAISPDTAYIETARCTTCNECTQINNKMFKYDDNKQAYIADPDAGTYRQLVEAAESCQVSIIHPGKPRNKAEPNLDELIERAEPFN